MSFVNTEADAELPLDPDIDPHRASVPNETVAIPANALSVSREVLLERVARHFLKRSAVMITEQCGFGLIYTCSFLRLQALLALFGPLRRIGCP